MMFIPLRKADAAQRLVFGSLDETPDRVGEIFDYASSKPNFQAWSDQMRAASGGKSLGNIRSMHGLTSAGKLVGLDFDDAAKRIDLCAHIVDDNEWEKVEQGVYTGFSPGGRYAGRWRQGPHIRYTAKPSEISLVDTPCIPSAGFTLIKADGDELRVSFRAVTEDAPIGDSDELRAALAKAGARNSKADMMLIQQVHDCAASLGAVCDHERDAGAGMAKILGDYASARDALAKALSENDRLAKRIQEFEAMPSPGGPRLFAVPHAADTMGNHFEQVAAMAPGPEKSIALIKMIHARR